jgi:hypothetical protein
MKSSVLLLPFRSSLQQQQQKKVPIQLIINNQNIKN